MAYNFNDLSGCVGTFDNIEFSDDIIEKISKLILKKMMEDPAFASAYKREERRLKLNRVKSV